MGGYEVFAKGISLESEQLVFELDTLMAAVQHFTHYATRTILFFFYFDIF